MLVFVAFYASVIVTRGTYGALRLDSLATLLYVSNWHFVLVGSDYFNQNAQTSPLIHTWSLAVEEQFYSDLAPGGAGRGQGALQEPASPFRVALSLLAAGSAAEMYLLFHDGASTNRLFYGTDTRAQCLFIGCALAVGLVLLTKRSHSEGRLAPGELWTPKGNMGRTLCGLEHRRPEGAAVALTIWVQSSDTSSFPFQGGFFPIGLGHGRRHPLGHRCPPEPGAPLLVAGAHPLPGQDLLAGLKIWHSGRSSCGSTRRALAWRGYGLFFLARPGSRWPWPSPRTTWPSSPSERRHVPAPVAGLRRRPLCGGGGPGGHGGGHRRGLVGLGVRRRGQREPWGAPSRLPRRRRPPPRRRPDRRSGFRCRATRSRVRWPSGWPNRRFNRSTNTPTRPTASSAAVWSTARRSSRQVRCSIPPGLQRLDLRSPVAASVNQPWPYQWLNAMAVTHPNVVALLAGRWEVVDREYQGKWTNHRREPRPTRPTSNANSKLLAAGQCGRGAHGVPDRALFRRG